MSINKNDTLNELKPTTLSKIVNDINLEFGPNTFSKQDFQILQRCGFPNAPRKSPGKRGGGIAGYPQCLARAVRDATLFRLEGDTVAAAVEKALSHAEISLFDGLVATVFMLMVAYHYAFHSTIIKERKRLLNDLLSNVSGKRNKIDQALDDIADAEKSISKEYIACKFPLFKNIDLESLSNDLNLYERWVISIHDALQGFAPTASFAEAAGRLLAIVQSENDLRDKSENCRQWIKQNNVLLKSSTPSGK